MADLEVLEDNTELFENLMATATQRGLEAIGIEAERYAVEYEYKVDTGRLKNSITHVVDNDGDFVAIGTNVEYAIYIELGTHGNDGIHYLTKAAKNHVDVYRKILEKALKGA